MSPFRRTVLDSPRPLAMPIAVYPGLELVGARVIDCVTNPEIQAAASTAIHQRYRTPFVLSAMDLSVEAEAFGCEIHWSDHEIPTAIGHRVTNLDQAKTLTVPRVGDKRTAVYLDVVSRLSRLPDRPWVLAGLIGPFSLAARFTGVSEACGLTLMEPDLIHALVEKSAAFLTDYAAAFKRAGAHGVLMAEPAAGLLSPRGLREFSSAYIKRIVEAVDDDSFTLVLHNCAAKAVHLPAVIESGARAFHFGAPMDLAAALEMAGADRVVCGNLDPSGVFLQSKPDHLAELTRVLLQSHSSRRNFVISSGCDVPVGTPLANLDAFFEAVKDQAARDPLP